MLLNVWGFLCRCVWRMAAGELGSRVDGAESVLIDGAESSENLTLGQPTLNWPHGEGGEGLDASTEKSIYFMIHDAY